MKGCEKSKKWLGIPSICIGNYYEENENDINTLGIPSICIGNYYEVMREEQEVAMNTVYLYRKQLANLEYIKPLHPNGDFFGAKK